MPLRNTESTHMPLGDHLEELRRRVLWALAGLVPVFCIALAFGKPLMTYLIEPARQALREAGQPDTLTALGPLEVLGAYLKVSTIAAVIVGTPWVLYQLWRFVAPGLYKHERRYVYFLLPLSALLTAASVCFLYLVILPIMLTWLVGFGADIGATPPAVAPLAEGVSLSTVTILDRDPPVEALKPGMAWVNSSLHEWRVCTGVNEGAVSILSQPLRKDTVIFQQFSIEKYVSLLFTLTIAFAAIFQAPVVVLLLGWVGLIDNAFLSKFRRHAVLGCLVIAAFISPGDPTSLVLMWLPLIALYELGGVLLRVFPASRVRGATDPDATEGEG
ncbi:MAG: twin-arginine translocase subunit TatC [Phycisphaerales bacterium]|nr:twin-arginine translocase subunit TatC [Phycisphaerales bacterium]